MPINEHLRTEVLQRAETWMTDQNLPADCPNDLCQAVNKWRLGEVGKMNSYIYDKLLGRGIKDPDPPFEHVVPIVCEWCGRPIRYYEE